MMKSNYIAFYSGAGIGLLIGILMGLSVSPTVGVIIGALATSLAILLGLNDKHFSDAKAIRIGSFGFACVVGALLGIFIRANGILAPNIKSQFDKYKAVGFTNEQSMDFIAYERFGILNKDWKIYSSAGDSSSAGSGSKDGAPSGAELVHKGSFGGLFSAEVEESECVSLKDLTIDDSLPVILQRFETTGAFWKELVAGVEKEIDEKNQKTVLLAIRDGICAVGAGKFTDEDCQKFAAVTQQTSADELFEKFNKTGGIWQSLAAAIKTKVIESEQQKVMLILVRSVCNESK
jgi:hypothetical protein